jgi:hypothetical protein
MSTIDNSFDDFVSNFDKDYEHFKDDVANAHDLEEYWQACWDFINAEEKNIRELIDDLNKAIKDY